MASIFGFLFSAWWFVSLALGICAVAFFCALYITSSIFPEDTSRREGLWIILGMGAWLVAFFMSATFFYFLFELFGQYIPAVFSTIVLYVVYRRVRS